MTNPITKNTKDHRCSGQKLKIFDFDPLIGSGMPLWLENGTTLKQVITSYVNHLQRQCGITLVSTPEIGKKELYITSGHWDHYNENMFPAMTLDKKDDYILRPMTCPHHILIYKKTKWYENQLPIAYGENAKLYRYECSGGLCGLERTRCMELIDTHLFCSKKQISESMEKIFQVIEKIKAAFDIQYHSIVLSIRDKNNTHKFFQDDDLWNEAEDTLRNFLVEKNINFEIGLGDAAFYGPKIDCQIKTAGGRVITISTIQLDFLLPQKFNLQYFNKDQQPKHPIMIHIGFIGTLERFVSYLLEKDDGWLPFWLSPIQITLMPIDNKKHLEWATKMKKFYESKGIRVEVDSREVSVGKKIATAVEKRSFGFMVVGDKEIEEEVGDFDVTQKSEQNLKKYLSKIWKSRGKDERKTLDSESYPEMHPDFIKWACDV